MINYLLFINSNKQLHTKLIRFFLGEDMTGTQCFDSATYIHFKEISYNQSY